MGDINNLIFDADFYKQIYDDLRNLSVDDAHRHWIDHGFSEGRCPSFSALQSVLPPDYDPSEYLSMNSNLQTLFGTNLTLASAHYYQHGRFEKRPYKSSAIPIYSIRGNRTPWSMITQPNKPQELTIAYNDLPVTTFFPVT